MERKRIVKIAGATGLGAYFGSSIGIVGVLGGISGLLPCAVIAGAFAYLLTDKKPNKDRE